MTIDGIAAVQARIQEIQQQVKQQKAAYGSNPYVQGLGPNRKIVETFVRYAHDQGYISRRIPVEELFVPGTLGL